jgi:hypothetical protein
MGSPPIALPRRADRARLSRTALSSRTPWLGYGSRECAGPAVGAGVTLADATAAGAPASDFLLGVGLGGSNASTGTVLTTR